MFWSYSLIHCNMSVRIGFRLVLLVAVGLYHSTRNDGTVHLFGWKLDLEVLGLYKVPTDAKVRSHPAAVKSNKVQSSRVKRGWSKVTNPKKARDQKSVRQSAAKKGKTGQVAPWGFGGIHLAVVACGDRLEEPLVMIKSALLFSRTKLHLHIFADEDLQPWFRKRLDKMPKFIQNKFQYHIHNTKFPTGQKPGEWRKLSKECASQRLFLPTILKDVRRVLYVDTDIIFMRPIEDIWAFFKEFNSTHLAALAWEHEERTAGWYNRFSKIPYYPPFGLNSGVMLMDLPRMRAAGWTRLVQEYFQEYKTQITWGDQDLINIFFHHFPEKLYVISCDYNYRPDHCMYTQTCKPAGNMGVSIVHGSRQVYHNEKQMTFRAIYEAFDKFDYDQSMQTSLVDAIHDNIGAISSKTKDSCVKHQDLFTKRLRQSIQNTKNCNCRKTVKIGYT